MREKDLEKVIDALPFLNEILAEDYYNYLSNENDIFTYLVKNMIYREGESLWIILLK